MARPVPLRSQRKSDSTRHVRDLLRVEILSNRTDAGAPLPSEPELMLEYHATRNVVREALALLRDEGLIERTQGAGTFVISHKILHRFDILHGVGDGYPNRGRRIAGQLTDIALRPAPALVATKLELGVGEPCLLVEAFVSFDGAPFSLSTSYLHPRLEAPIRAAAFGGDWYELLEGLGCELQTSTLNVEATLADECVAPVLDLAVGAPLILFTRLIRNASGEPVDFGFVRVRGDRLRLQVPLVRATTTYVTEPDEERL